MPRKKTLYSTIIAVVALLVVAYIAYLIFKPAPIHQAVSDEFGCIAPPDLVQLDKKDLEVGAVKIAKVSLGQLSLKNAPSLVNLFSPGAKNLQVIEYYVCREKERAKKAKTPMTEEQISYFRSLWAFMAAVPPPNAEQISTWQDKHPAPMPPTPRGQLHVYPEDLHLARAQGQFTIQNIGDARLHWWIEAYGDPYFFIDPEKLKGDLEPDKDAEVRVAWLYANSLPPKKQFVEIYADPSPKPPEKPKRVGLNVDARDVAAYRTLKEKVCAFPNADTAWQVKTANKLVAKSLSGVSTPVHKFIAGQMLLDAGAYPAANAFLEASDLTTSGLAGNSVYQRYRALASLKTGNDYQATKLFEALAKEPKLSRSDTDSVYASALALDTLGKPDSARNQLVSWTTSVQNSGFKFKATCDNPRLTEFRSTSNVQSILEKLLKAAAKRLSVSEGSLRANVFLFCDDGYLRIPKGFSVHMEDKAELTIRIPVGLGSTGTAFQKQQFVVTLLNPDKLGSCALEEDDISSNDWRQALLPATETAKVNQHLAWIVSHPIMSSDLHIIGVLNIDSLKIKNNRGELEALKADMALSAQSIATVLEPF